VESNGTSEPTFTLNINLHTALLVTLLLIHTSCQMSAVIGPLRDSYNKNVNKWYVYSSEFCYISTT